MRLIDEEQYLAIRGLLKIIRSTEALKDVELILGLLDGAATLHTMEVPPGAVLVLETVERITEHDFQNLRKLFTDRGIDAPLICYQAGSRFSAADQEQVQKLLDTWKAAVTWEGPGQPLVVAEETCAGTPAAAEG